MLTESKERLTKRRETHLDQLVDNVGEQQDYLLIFDKTELELYWNFRRKDLLAIHKYVNCCMKSAVLSGVAEQQLTEQD